MSLLPVPSALPLATARLLLRPYTPQDAPDFFELLHHNRTRLEPAFPRRLAAVQTLADAEQTLRTFAANWRQRRLLVWGIWHAATGAYLGDISLQPDTARARTGEIGYYLSQQAEGYGYAREALRAVVQYAFQELHSQEVHLRCRTDNARSQATAEALGFRQQITAEPGIWQYSLGRNGT